MKNQALMRTVVALVAGTIFSIGLSVSGMVDPARVLGFLDIASGHWDPSLMFVLGGAVLAAVPGVMLQRQFVKPVLDVTFHLPEKTTPDKRLVAGSAIFGVGWGSAGFCPGPAISALATGQPAVILFIVTMAVGMVFHDRFLAARSL